MRRVNVPGGYEYQFTESEIAEIICACLEIPPLPTQDRVSEMSLEMREIMRASYKTGFFWHNWFRNFAFQVLCSEKMSFEEFIKLLYEQACNRRCSKVYVRIMSEKLGLDF